MAEISIIICTHNRSALLVETIYSLLSIVKNNPKYEIVIVDNKSTDQTREEVEKWTINSPTIKYYYEENIGLSHARNRGIREAVGEILIFMDDDVEIDEKYFEICHKFFTDNTRNILGGKVLPYRIDVPAWLPKKYYYLVSIFDLGDREIKCSTLMGANYAMRNSVVSKVGLYNTELGRKGDNLMGGEENDYLERAVNKGFEIYYSPDLIVYHKINDKLNIKYVYEHARLNGRSNAIMLKKTSYKKYLLKQIKALVLISFATIVKNLLPFGRLQMGLQIQEKYSYGYLGKIEP